ncbi:uncharacterized protein TNCV_2390721 [Trichonephila clavipes]|nr:uncharacterized protein TNCV_2390721 [Trichonephila clavipes]
MTFPEFEPSPYATAASVAKHYTERAKTNKSDRGMVAAGLGSNPGEGTDVCTMPSQHGITLNSRRAERPLVRLVEGEERREASGHPQGILPQNWDGTGQNHSVTYMVLKAKANDRRKNLALSHDEFCGH